jgi:polyisoprenoid-binding protein YceI
MRFSGDFRYRYEEIDVSSRDVRSRHRLRARAGVVAQLPNEVEVGLRIATATVSTGFKFFDSRLRQPDLLASDEFPEAYFVASRFRFGTEAGQPALAEVRGEFTLRGRGVPLSLDALRFGCRPAGAAQPAVTPAASTPTELASAAAAATAPTAEVCGGDFEGEVLRSDFGATFGLPLVGDRVRLRVQVEGQRL